MAGVVAPLAAAGVAEEEASVVSVAAASAEAVPEGAGKIPDICFSIGIFLN